MSDTFRIEYTPVSEENKATIKSIKTKAQELFEMVEATPACRDRSIAITHLEDAIMRVTRGLTSEELNPVSK